MLKACALFLIVNGGISHVSGQESPRKSIAYVYDVSGKWRRASQSTGQLKPGDGLQLDEIIKPSEADSAPSITIGFVDGTVHTEGCAIRIQDCSYTVKKEKGKSAGNPAGIIMKRLFNIGPWPIAFAISRSTGLALLRESVIHAGPQPDLLPLTGTLPNGGYDAVFRNGASSRPIRIACEWKDKTGACNGLLSPGFYQVQLEQDGDVLAGPVAVFVADANFKDAAAQFQEALDIVAGWPSDTPSGARHYFLASVLTDLADGRAR